jgi:hypothetical protein
MTTTAMAPCPDVALLTIDGPASLCDLGVVVRRALRRGAAVIVVELQCSATVTHAAMGRLVALHAHARLRDAELRLVCEPWAAPAVRHMLAGCGPSVHESLVEALVDPVGPV